MAITGEMRILRECGYVPVYTEWDQFSGWSLSHFTAVKRKTVAIDRFGTAFKTNIRRSGISLPVLEIELCNGCTIRCSTDHTFLVIKDGMEIRINANALIKGDLLPFFTTSPKDGSTFVEDARSRLSDLLSNAFVSVINIGSHNCLDVILPTIIYVDHMVIDLLTIGVVSKIIEQDNCTVLRVSGNRSARILLGILNTVKCGELEFGQDFDSLVVVSVSDGGTSDMYCLDVPQEISINGVITIC